MASMLFIDLIFWIICTNKDVYERLERGYTKKKDIAVKIVKRQKGFPAKETRMKEHLKQWNGLQLPKKVLVICRRIVNLVY